MYAYIFIFIHVHTYMFQTVGMYIRSYIWICVCLDYISTTCSSPCRRKRLSVCVCEYRYMCVLAYSVAFNKGHSTKPSWRCLGWSLLHVAKKATVWANLPAHKHSTTPSRAPRQARALRILISSGHGRRCHGLDAWYMNCFMVEGDAWGVLNSYGKTLSGTHTQWHYSFSV